MSQVLNVAAMALLAAAASAPLTAGAPGPCSSGLDEMIALRCSPDDIVRLWCSPDYEWSDGRDKCVVDRERWARKVCLKPVAAPELIPALTGATPPLHPPCVLCPSHLCICE
jgi:hypothetical protein